MFGQQSPPRDDIIQEESKKYFPMGWASVMSVGRTWLCRHAPCAQATRLVELLDEAKERCKGTIKERRGNDISDEELEESSSIMGYGAIKYADLKNNRKTDYKYAAADLH